MTTELTPQVVHSEQDKKSAIQGALYYLLNTRGAEFYGLLLQMMTMRYDSQIPTACLQYDLKTKTFQIRINPDFFLKFSTEERVAILHHEILHFTNKHILRFELMKVPPEEQMMLNVAADMAINQLIENMPKDCVDYKNWKMKDGSVFPALKDMETYYDLIKDNKSSNKDKFQEMQSGEDGVIDEHMWNELPDDVKKELLEEAKGLIKRTIEKSSHSYTKVPSSVEEYLQELESESNKLNAKQILRNVIKRTVSCADRHSTWTKPNKRYGVFSPGTKIGDLPLLQFYIDTSGSISVREANEFLAIMNQFLKVGVRKTTLNLWHDSLYYKNQYKYNTPLKREVFESGGTVVQNVLDDIKKTKPDLSICLTDGYFESSNTRITSEMIWIISPGGNKDHPLKHIGKTFALEDFK